MSTEYNIPKRVLYIQKSGMSSDQDMFNRYKEKEFEFDKETDISLIGHSLFDMWSNIAGYQPILAGKSVANLGLSGSSTYQYLDTIIRPQRIKQLGKTVFIFLGVNDILKEIDYSPKQVMEWIKEIFLGLKQISPDSDYFLLESTPILNRPNIKSSQIRELNQYLKNNRPPGLGFIETYQAFSDQKQDLAQSLTTDGIHFTAKGYNILTELLVAHIDK